jgi:hypothetical protein
MIESYALSKNAGESIAFSQSDLKHQKKLVRNLKKKSLWSRNLEEVYCYSYYKVIFPSMLNSVFSHPMFPYFLNEVLELM